MKAPVFENIKKTFRGLKRPHKKVVSDLEKAKEMIWKKSIEYRIISKFDDFPMIDIRSYFFFVFIALLLGSMELGSIGLIIFSIITIYVLFLFVLYILKSPLKNRVLARNKQNLLPYVQKADTAKISLQRIK